MARGEATDRIWYKKVVCSRCGIEIERCKPRLDTSYLCFTCTAARKRERALARSTLLKSTGVSRSRTKALLAMKGESKSAGTLVALPDEPVFVVSTVPGNGGSPGHPSGIAETKGPFAG